MPDKGNIRLLTSHRGRVKIFLVPPKTQTPTRRAAKHKHIKVMLAKREEEEARRRKKKRKRKANPSRASLNWWLADMVIRWGCYSIEAVPYNDELEPHGRRTTKTGKAQNAWVRMIRARAHKIALNISPWSSSITFLFSSFFFSAVYLSFLLAVFIFFSATVALIAFTSI